MKKLILAFICLFLALPCKARTITVDDDGPADFNNIQAAIDDANAGDTIVVAEGTYYENIRMKDGITLQGSDPHGTIIDGGENGHVVVFNLASGTISGFTITNSGQSPLYSAGVFTSQCNVRIENNIITNNNIGITLSSNSNGIIVDNKVVNNSGSRAIKLSYSEATILNNIVAHNSRRAIHCYESLLVVINNTIANNGTIGITLSLPSSQQVIANNIIAQNEFGIMACGGEESCVPLLYITYNDVWDNSKANYWEEYGVITILDGGWMVSRPFTPQPGIGEISKNPLFADAATGDYHLQSTAGRCDPNSQTWVADANTSPCIDAGNPGCPLDSEPMPNGNRINVGAYGGTATASKTPANWRGIADLTNDWAVDFKDLEVFTNYWLDSGQCIPSDLNRSQSVNFTDFAIFADN